MKRKTGELYGGLLLHDALVKDVRISEINYAEQNVSVFLDTAQAMSKAKALHLECCRRLDMDDVAGCWWLGERLTQNENGVVIEAELVTASGEKRKLIAQCRRLVFE